VSHSDELRTRGSSTEERTRLVGEADCRLARAEAELARALTTDPDELPDAGMSALRLIIRTRLFLKGLV